MSDPIMTWPEVADKTVDHIANGVQQIADAVGNMAPGAWQYAVRKNRLEGVVDICFAASIILALVAGYVVIWKLSKQCDDEVDRAGIRGISGLIGAAVAALFALYLLKPGIVQATNPEYYAALEIVAAVRK